MNELYARVRTELEPPWDDLREARVLSRVLEEGSVTQRPAFWRRPLSVAALGLPMTAALLAGLWLRSPALSGTPHREPQPGARVLPEKGQVASVLSLADGSRAHLKAGAEVQALEQSPGVVRLAQRTGEVRYEVNPDARRPFSVVARNVEVRVIGTVFTVVVEPEAVSISVERGRVAVKSGTRDVELSPGENLRLSLPELPAAAPGKVVSSAAAVDGDAAPLDSETAKVLPVAPAATPARLLEEADQARLHGDLASAERLLGRLVAQHAGSPQATSAAFSLGRIQSARGNFAAAARTFEALRQRSPRGPLAEDALAEAANAWALAGQSAQARALAGQYLSRYPGGPHAERMRRLGAR